MNHNNVFYITNFTRSKMLWSLWRAIDIIEIQPQDLEPLISKASDLIQYNSERRQIKKLRGFFEDLDIHIESIYKIKSKNFSDEARQPLRSASKPLFFHVNTDCKRLKSDYENLELVCRKPEDLTKVISPMTLNDFNKNYIVPAAIKTEKQLPENVSNQEFIKTFWENFSFFILLHTSIDFSCIKACFGIETVKKKNSGHVEINNFSEQQLFNSIEDQIEVIEFFYEENREILSQKKETYPRKIIGIDHQLEVASNIHNQWKNQKDDLKFLLTEYYRMRFNPDIEKLENLLDSLNFTHCRHCKQYIQNNTPVNNIYPSDDMPF
ncbi:hypothetical protein [Synechococcus sp. BDU 130192]|uniref:hypothetical protein n=1 Tax=Synechococcus sp. BDU 130192 TaxID=2042059 RepID=UPI000C082023|nr:hypothetical protein [Synechococcus sp. BDU 130192]